MVPRLRRLYVNSQSHGLSQRRQQRQWHNKHRFAVCLQHNFGWSYYRIWKHWHILQRRYSRSRHLERRLTAAEIASLAKGMTCDKVRPESLVFYAPLVRDLIDAKGGLTITNNNGATVANHPRVYA
jgi:hypothetical protein